MPLWVGILSDTKASDIYIKLRQNISTQSMPHRVALYHIGQSLRSRLDNIQFVSTRFSAMLSLRLIIFFVYLIGFPHAKTDRLVGLNLDTFPQTSQRSILLVVSRRTFNLSKGLYQKT